MNYIIVTNTYKRPVDLVARSRHALLSQKIEPQKVFFEKYNLKLSLSDDITSNELFTRIFTDKKSVSAAGNSSIIPAR